MRILLVDVGVMSELGGNEHWLMDCPLCLWALPPPHCHGALMFDGERHCCDRRGRDCHDIHPLGRRHLEEQLEAAVSAARRHVRPLSVLFIDIDSFKRINDQSGYEAGDDVLRTVGDRVRLALRTEDLVGRWGGEEFVAVLPTTDLSGAVAVAERVRAAVASHPISIDDRQADVTVSVGCASGGGEPAELIRPG